MSQLHEVPGLYAAVSDILNRELHQARVRLDKIEGALRWFNKLPHETVTFEVTLHSLWAEEGESNVTSRSRRGLKQALQQAQSRFKKVNNRSDVQAKYSVRVYFGTVNQFSILVPDAIYTSFK